MLHAEDIDMDVLIDSFNTATTEAANEILGKHQPVKKPCVTSDILDLCGKRRKLKKKKYETEGFKQYRAVKSGNQEKHDQSK